MRRDRGGEGSKEVMWSAGRRIERADTKDTIENGAHNENENGSAKLSCLSGS